jgi:anti-sigma regulatory factor (Ser/Thr protein kinase)
MEGFLRRRARVTVLVSGILIAIGVALVICWGTRRQKWLRRSPREALAPNRGRHQATLQHALLPATLPEMPGIKLNAVYLPGKAEAEFGGDWYDAFCLPNGRIALSIGDVAGHGLPAAAAMGGLRQAVRAAALEYDDPAEVLTRASRLLDLATDGMGIATAVFGVLDPVSRTFMYATAGHPPPILAEEDRKVTPLPSGGLPLGVRTRSVSPSWSVPVPPGSLLVLYTDGLIEHTRNPIEGEAALTRAVREECGASSPNPARTIEERVLAGGRPPDDVAVLTVSLAPAVADRFDLNLRADPAVLLPFRQSFRGFAGELGIDPERSEALVVAVGEAMNNAIEHAYLSAPGTIDVRARREGAALVIEVEDHGRWRTTRLENRGHGLDLMRMLADSVMVDTTPAGTKVRLTFALANGG